MNQLLIEQSWHSRSACQITARMWHKLPLRTQSAYKQEILNAPRVQLAPEEEREQILHKITTHILGLIYQKPIQVDLNAIVVPMVRIAGHTNMAQGIEWAMGVMERLTLANVLDMIHQPGNAYRTERWWVRPKQRLQPSIVNELRELFYGPPLIEKPRDWSHLQQGGWHSYQASAMLGSGYHSHNKVRYDVLNLLQQVPFELDQDVLTHFEQDNDINTLQTAKVLSLLQNRQFHFVWQYDYRGRMYSAGYHVNIQSNAWGKAMLNFGKKQIITSENAVLANVANAYGHDKVTWKERIAIGRELVSQKNFEADCTQYKAMKMYQDYRDGIPSNGWISLDATASGIQIMAALSRCTATAKWVNLIDPTKRYDIYQEVADEMNKRVNKPVTRDLTKPALMTSAYNSVATPRKLFTPEQCEVFYDVMALYMPGAIRVMEAINHAFDPNRSTYRWTLPDGHQVKFRTIKDCSGTYNSRHIPQATFQWKEPGPTENYRALAPNVIHSIDAYIAREMVRRCYERGVTTVTIHDCFLTHPNHWMLIQKTYAEIMTEVWNSDLLNSILQQITVGAASDRRFKPDDYPQRISSIYALS